MLLFLGVPSVLRLLTESTGKSKSCKPQIAESPFRPCSSQRRSKLILSPLHVSSAIVALWPASVTAQSKHGILVSWLMNVYLCVPDSSPTVGERATFYWRSADSVPPSTRLRTSACHCFCLRLCVWCPRWTSVLVGH
ncbi:hypothetical protein EXIGLDRAFT_28849 [Exidia glandulosa HHB12029]|uniref:Uncharacterized protein n=1 Tax=Exidia glandulosa HHB12029 TaxID=1314781 RepID=A0A165P9T6_EXIGL|nr:hypothetical protein EXIGLDRAFT_28849 [Exidia glandulosa HHB12029]